MTGKLILFNGKAVLRDDGKADVGLECAPFNFGSPPLSFCLLFRFRSMSAATASGSNQWRTTPVPDTDFYVPFFETVTNTAYGGGYAGDFFIVRSVFAAYHELPFFRPESYLIDATLAGTASTQGDIAEGRIGIGFVATSNYDPATHSPTTRVVSATIEWRVGAALLLSVDLPSYTFSGADFDGTNAIYDLSGNPTSFDNSLVEADSWVGGVAAFGGTVDVYLVPCPCRCGCNSYALQPPSTGGGFDTAQVRTCVCGAAYLITWEIQIVGYNGGAAFNLIGIFDACGGYARAGVTRDSDSTSWSVASRISVEILDGKCTWVWRFAFSSPGDIRTVCWQILTAPFLRSHTTPPSYSSWTAYSAGSNEIGSYTCAGGTIAITDTHIGDTPCPLLCDAEHQNCATYIRITATLTNGDRSESLSLCLIISSEGICFWGRADASDDKWSGYIAAVVADDGTCAWRLGISDSSSGDDAWGAILLTLALTSSSCPISTSYTLFSSTISGTSVVINSMSGSETGCSPPCPTDLTDFPEFVRGKVAFNGGTPIPFCLEKSGDGYGMVAAGAGITDITLGCSDGRWGYIIEDSDGNDWFISAPVIDTTTIPTTGYVVDDGPDDGTAVISDMATGDDCGCADPGDCDPSTRTYTFTSPDGTVTHTATIVYDAVAKQWNYVPGGDETDWGVTIKCVAGVNTATVDHGPSDAPSAGTYTFTLTSTGSLCDIGGSYASDDGATFTVD